MNDLELGPEPDIVLISFLDDSPFQHNILRYCIPWPEEQE